MARNATIRRRHKQINNNRADGLANQFSSQGIQRLVASQLSKVVAIEAVFVLVDEDKKIHVYSVVPDFSFGLYKRLVKREEVIEKKLPGMKFDFHVRAHQGRKADRAVPVGALPVFVR